MRDIVFLYVTAPDIETAKSLSMALIENRAAACTNLYPNVTAIFPWQGKIETAAEVVMIVKTTKAAAGAARDLIVKHHPYETPCVVAFESDPSLGGTGYARWIEDCTEPRAT